MDNRLVAVAANSLAAFCGVAGGWGVNEKERRTDKEKTEEKKLSQ
jgi:hypothetical protein